jgi:hypothetical protein
MDYREALKGFVDCVLLMENMTMKVISRGQSMVPDRGISSSLTRSVVLCFVYLLRELLGLYAKYQGHDAYNPKPVTLTLSVKKPSKRPGM